MDGPVSKVRLGVIQNLLHNLSPEVFDGVMNHVDYSIVHNTSDSYKQRTIIGQTVSHTVTNLPSEVKVRWMNLKQTLNGVVTPLPTYLNVYQETLNLFTGIHKSLRIERSRFTCSKGHKQIQIHEEQVFWST